MKKSKESFFFQLPVDQIAYPDYLNFAKTPMDLSTMEYKINSGKYNTYLEFVEDSKLIMENCFAFNGKDSLISASAKSLHNICTRYIDRIPTELNSKNAPKRKLSDVYNFLLLDF